jgi:large subunit ribosomal protein L15|tara:strand:+ start:328 stop:966 length:639 start_codon:yes stop_codon:yes gene_type:complete
MRLHNLKPNPGAKTRRKRVGRGPGSGRGKTSTRGHKGQGSRAGSSTRATFEGGQIPYIRRLPKRGFSNARTRVAYLPVNLSDLEKHFEEGATVDVEAIKAAGLANGHDPIKVLAKGKLEKKISVTAHKFSASAKAAIEASGGSCTVLNAASVVGAPEASNSGKKSTPASTKETDKAKEALVVDDPEVSAPKEEESSSSEVETDATDETPVEE